jgi:hypothetical protein
MKFDSSPQQSTSEESGLESSPPLRDILTANLEVPPLYESSFKKLFDPLRRAATEIARARHNIFDVRRAAQTGIGSCDETV